LDQWKNRVVHSGHVYLSDNHSNKSFFVLSKR